MERDDLRSGAAAADANPKIRVFGRDVPMPRSRIVRMIIGVLLILLGLFGFLPVLGFWMIPAGLLVLSYDIAAIRRLRRRVTVWWGNRGRSARAAGGRGSS